MMRTRLSQVHPIFFNRELVLFAARLQDYSYRLNRLVSLTPTQFCKSGDLFSMRIRLNELQTAQSFAQPRIIEVTEDDVHRDATNSSRAVIGNDGWPSPDRISELAEERRRCAELPLCLSRYYLDTQLR